MEYETLLFESDNGVATITLNRPERMNAWTPRMARELGRAMARCDGDDSVRAVVLTGSGRAFCAGIDMAAGDDAFSATDRERGTVETGYLGEPFPWQIRKPVFAAIQGHAIGWGITYPMTCDVRIVAEDAKVQFAFTRRGVMPELWSHAIVPRVAGLSNAADLLLTGRVVLGRELAAIGLASVALPAGQVLEATRERAREILLAAPISVALSKRLLWDALNLSLPELGPREARLFRWTGEQVDAREGVAAFLEKRTPNWKLRVSRDGFESGGD